MASTKSSPSAKPATVTTASKPNVIKPTVSNPSTSNSATVTKTITQPVAKKTAVVTPAKISKPTQPTTEAKATAASTSPKKNDKEKTPKLKMERDSFTMPKAEYAQIYVLKDRLVKLGKPAKKSELLRAGLMLLSALNDANLAATMLKIPAIKTGRPKK